MHLEDGYVQDYKAINRQKPKVMSTCQDKFQLKSSLSDNPVTKIYQF